MAVQPTWVGSPPAEAGRVWELVRQFSCLCFNAWFSILQKWATIIIDRYRREDSRCIFFVRISENFKLYSFIVYCTIRNYIKILFKIKYKSYLIKTSRTMYDERILRSSQRRSARILSLSIELAISKNNPDLQFGGKRVQSHFQKQSRFPNVFFFFW